MTNTPELPTDFALRITVPFPLESKLSGVGRVLQPDEFLWYRRHVDAPWEGTKVLHFDAVDFEATVFIDGIQAATHRGGYSPFTLEVQATSFDVVVRVTDPTDTGEQPRGKQTLHPGGIWYTPCSGIWQPVWLEPVPDRYVQTLTPLVDFDARTLTLCFTTNDAKDVHGSVTLLDGNTELLTTHLSAEPIPLPAAVQPWTPDTPHLYTLRVTTTSGDALTSYFALRKFSRETHAGVSRFFLNNTPYFVLGVLDQGYWPDGLYTAPSDAALLADVRLAKTLGFNMIRKHAKTEPLRWYHHCDTVGMLVWQDMPSRCGVNPTPGWEEEAFSDYEPPITPAAKPGFLEEWRAIRAAVGVSPCVSVWVPFNEAWGQFDTDVVARETRDGVRLVDAASGGNHRPGVGDFIDCHSYPAPRMKVLDSERIRVVGEYGGIARRSTTGPAPDAAGWGYVDSDDVQTVYVSYLHALAEIPGLSGAVYTQLTDVETEVNGLVTYDRTMPKVDVATVCAANRELVARLSV